MSTSPSEEASGRIERLAALKTLGDAYPQGEYREFLRYIGCILQNFDREAYLAARKRGEAPSEHAGLMPSLIRDVNYWITPGSPGRAISILDGKNIVDMISPEAEERRHVTWGVYEDRVGRSKLKVGVFATQMGPASCDINYGLDFLSNAPDRVTTIRPGTAGTMHPRIRTGDLAIGSLMVGVEDLCDTYIERDVVLGSSPLVMAALELAAADSLMPGIDALLVRERREAERRGYYHIGMELTKGSLQWEIGLTPFKTGQRLASAYLESLGVTHSSMEGKCLAALHTIYENELLHPKAGHRQQRRMRFGTVNAIMNDHPSLGKEALFSDDKERQRQGVELACLVAEKAIRTLYLFDNDKLSKRMRKELTRIRDERRRALRDDAHNVRLAEDYLKKTYQVR